MVYVVDQNIQGLFKRPDHKFILTIEVPRIDFHIQLLRISLGLSPRDILDLPITPFQEPSHINNGDMLSAKGAPNPREGEIHERGLHHFEETRSTNEVFTAWGFLKVWTGIRTYQTCRGFTNP